jgi:putative FmdB family regulatory protein
MLQTVTHGEGEHASVFLENFFRGRRVWRRLPRDLRKTLESEEMGNCPGGTLVPLYEYRCTVCGHGFEKIQKFSDEPERECPKCHGALERPMTAPALRFEGAGWYVNDYAGKGGAKAGDGAEAGKADAMTEAKAGEKTEAKAAASESGASSSAAGAAAPAAASTAGPSAASGA